MSKSKPISFSSLQLKGIGYVFTLVGAIGMTFFTKEEQYVWRMILELISYPAIAIFVFLLTEGVRHTRDLKKYALSLTVAALITEPFYDYACIGVWFDTASSNGQNFLAALLLCVLILLLLRSVPEEGKKRIFMICSLIPAVIFWAFLFNIRHGIAASLMTIVFSLLSQKQRARNILAFIVGTVTKYSGGLSVPLIQKYNGERGSYPKYLFYGLYPAMWAILAVWKLISV